MGSSFGSSRILSNDDRSRQDNASGVIRAFIWDCGWPRGAVVVGDIEGVWSRGSAVVVEAYSDCRG